MAYPTAYSRVAKPADESDDSLMGETHRGAALICIIGFFLRILLSDPVMLALGLGDTGDATGGTAEKLHPGTYLICLSFFVLLIDRKEPMRQLMRLFQDCTIYSLLLLFYIMLFAYWAARDPSGVGMLIETHMTVPICAIVFSYTPKSWCRRTVYGFIALMVINSVMGVIEAIGKFRFFTFAPDWVVLKETLFRASAFLGHPLSNAMFTSLALFIMLSTRLSGLFKTILLAVFLTSLVAFGGRSALAATVIGLVPLAFMAIRNQARTRSLSLQQVFLLCAAGMVIPILIAGGLYLLINSDLGERIGSMSSMDDESAGARWVVFRIFDYVSWEEILLGVSTNRIIDIIYRISLSLPMVDIENPWLLMFLYMGAIFFSIWMVLLLFFIRKLMRGASPSIKIAVATYFIIASTSNSFGRKDYILATMAAMAICARSAFGTPPPEHE